MVLAGLLFYVVVLICLWLGELIIADCWFVIAMGELLGCAVVYCLGLGFVIDFVYC